MERTLYEYDGYKRALKALIPYGGKLKLAGFLGCNPGYVSQVLNGRAHLSLEQAERAARFMGLTEDEKQHWMLLVQRDRAGTQELKRFFDEQLRRISESRLNLKHRLKFRKTVHAEDQARYYSSWHYVAVHMALSLPAHGSASAVARYLGLPGRLVSDVIAFLLEAGLIAKGRDSYHAGTVSIHLPEDSPLVSKHHANWRFRAIESCDRVTSRDLHYTSVVTIADKDVVEVRRILVQAIERVRKLVADSPEDSAHCYSVDLFPLRSGD